LLLINIKFKFKDLDLEFKADIERNKPYTFEIGEEMLSDKLFWILVGLDKNYEGEITGEGVCLNASSWNNVLALGDKGMFIRGTVYKNIYKALRVRSKRAEAKNRALEVIKLYNLELLSSIKIHLLTDEELLRVATARAHYRKIALVVAKSKEIGKIDFTKWQDSYIIKIV